MRKINNAKLMEMSEWKWTHVNYIQSLVLDGIVVLDTRNCTVTSEIRPKIARLIILKERNEKWRDKGWQTIVSMRKSRQKWRVCVWWAISRWSRVISCYIREAVPMARECAPFVCVCAMYNKGRWRAGAPHWRTCNNVLRAITFGLYASLRTLTVVMNHLKRRVNLQLELFLCYTLWSKL